MSELLKQIILKWACKHEWLEKARKQLFEEAYDKYPNEERISKSAFWRQYEATDLIYDPTPPVE